MRKCFVLFRAALFTTALLMLAEPVLAEDGHILVLVTGAQSGVSALPPAEVRKLYLGVAFQAGGAPIQPLRNHSDPLLREVFLQNVLFMSEPMYERALLLGVLRTKGARPPIYESQDALLEALRNTHNTVTYMWSDTARSLSDIKVVSELWHAPR
jgi:hypothetical protein